MIISVGNASPHDQGIPVAGPALTIVGVSDGLNGDGSYLADFIVGSDVNEIKDHLYDNPGMTTHLPGNGLLVQIIRSVSEQSNGRPTFVSVEAQGRDPESADDLERFLAEFWRCERGIPADLEDTHYTISGPPGTGPEGE